MKKEMYHDTILITIGGRDGFKYSILIERKYLP